MSLGRRLSCRTRYRQSGERRRVVDGATLHKLGGQILEARRGPHDHRLGVGRVAARAARADEDGVDVERVVPEHVRERRHELQLEVARRAARARRRGRRAVGRGPERRRAVGVADDLVRAPREAAAGTCRPRLRPRSASPPAAGPGGAPRRARRGAPRRRRPRRGTRRGGGASPRRRRRASSPPAVRVDGRHLGLRDPVQRHAREDRARRRRFPFPLAAGGAGAAPVAAGGRRGGPARGSGAAPPGPPRRRPRRRPRSRRSAAGAGAAVAAAGSIESAPTESASTAAACARRTHHARASPAHGGQPKTCSARARPSTGAEICATTEPARAGAARRRRPLPPVQVARPPAEPRVRGAVAAAAGRHGEH